jgi:hypothetical protein
MSSRLVYVPVDVELAYVACVHLVDMDVFILPFYRAPSYSDLQNANQILFYMNFVQERKRLFLEILISLLWTGH